MKTNVFLTALMIVSLLFASCSEDQSKEELVETEQLENLDDISIDVQAIDKEEIGEDDT